MSVPSAYESIQLRPELLDEGLIFVTVVFVKVQHCDIPRLYDRGDSVCVVFQVEALNMCESINHIALLNPLERPICHLPLCPRDKGTDNT